MVDFNKHLLEEVRQERDALARRVQVLEAERAAMLAELGLSEEAWCARQDPEPPRVLTPPPLPPEIAQALSPPPLPPEIAQALSPPPLPAFAQLPEGLPDLSEAQPACPQEPSFVDEMEAIGISFSDLEVPGEVSGDGLFSESRDRARRDAEFSYTPEQEQASEDVERWIEEEDPAVPIYAFTGPAGSGKTTVAKKIVEDHYGFTLTGMTGKAAVRLRQVTGMDTSTLHAKLYWPPAPGGTFESIREPPSKLVLVDEASMMGPSVVRDLRKWGARVLLIGDGYQLPPVITGKDFQQYGDNYSVFREVAGTHIQTVMRSVGGVLRAATQLRTTGKIPRSSDLDSPGNGYEFLRSRTPMGSAVDRYLEGYRKGDDVMLITWRNQVRMNANKVIRATLGHDGPLPDPGEPVLLKRNGQGYLNGEILSAERFETGPVIAGVKTLWMHPKVGVPIMVTVDGGPSKDGGEWFDGQSPWIEDWKKYRIELEKKKLPEPTPITWGYCLSGHSAQGSQARDVIVFLSPGDERSGNFQKPTQLPDGSQAPFSARWFYTAITRATHLTQVHVG